MIECVFYIGTNSITGTNYLRRVEAIGQLTGIEFFAEVLKANLIAGVTNFVIVTVRKNGIEGVPSNEVSFVPPRAAVLRLFMQSGPSTSGPWRTLTNAPVEVAVTDPHQFFRLLTTD